MTSLSSALQGPADTSRQRRSAEEPGDAHRRVQPLGPGKGREWLSGDLGAHIPAPLPQAPKQDLAVLFTEGQVLAAIYMCD